MGFNNGGVTAADLKKNNGVLIGGNIGKNKLTPNEEATLDYEICFDALYDYDYFVVNVSSKYTKSAPCRIKNRTQLLQTLQNKNLAKPKQNNFVKKLLQI
jgi:dihydroorotate dehydrogenase